jgi:hypothetical protein
MVAASVFYLRTNLKAPLLNKQYKTQQQTQRGGL